MQRPIRSNRRGGFTGELWHSIESIYARILAHPFLQGLTDGTLTEEGFRYYVLQRTCNACGNVFRLPLTIDQLCRLPGLDSKPY